MNFFGRFLSSASIFLFVACTMLISACEKQTNKIPRETMSELSPRLQTIFEKTHKICFGRFLIEIPATATVVYGPFEVEAPTIYYKSGAIELPRHLKDRLSEIEQEKRFFLKGEAEKLPLLGKTIDGDRPGQKIIYGSKDQVNYDIHSFVPVNDDLYVMQFTSPSEEDQMHLINQIASVIRSRTEDEIPSEPGTCVEGGFIPFEAKYERTTIGIRLKEFPDIHLSIDAHKNLEYLSSNSSPKELRKQARKFAEADGLGAVFAQTKILRQQDRQLNNWKGEELALRTPAYMNDKSVHEFRFYSAGAINDRLHPELDIRLDSGLKGNHKARVEPSLTDEEALALWDKIINTIRIRQPSDATPAKPAAPKVPLASTVRTGEICPETGWWECSAAQRIEGRKQRLFKTGETMPLVLLKEPGLWQKLTGQHAVRQIATVWQLVQYDDETPLSIAG